MKKFNCPILVLFFLFCLAFSTSAQTNWPGEYFFGEDGGETVGGTKIYIAHTLKIRNDGDKLTAHLYSQGYQTSKDIYADVKTEGNKLRLYFREKGKDHVFGDYQKGDLLLSLERKTIAGKDKILTFWEKFQPTVPANEKSGAVYFQRKKIKKTGKFSSMDFN
jgi:hypothetical protein